MKRLSLVALAALLFGCPSRLDLDQGREYPCTSDAECSSGFICGLEGRCHDVTSGGGEWKCNGDDRYCGAGWRCGLNDLCHSKDVGAPYACNVDDDCEQGWRCNSVSHVCADATLEGVQETKPLAMKRVSPALPTNVKLYETSDYFEFAGDAPWGHAGDQSLHEVFVDDSSVNHLLTVGNAIFGPRPPADFTNEFYDRKDPLPQGGVDAVANYGLTTYAGGPNGLYRTVLQPASSPWEAVGAAGFKTKGIRIFLGTTSTNGSQYTTRDSVWAFGGTSFTVIDAQTGSVTSALDMPPGVTETVELQTRRFSSLKPELVLAVTDRGLYSTDREGTGFVNGTSTSPDWKPLAITGFPNADCASATPLHATRAAMSYDSSSGVMTAVLALDWSGSTKENPTLVFLRNPDVVGNRPFAACAPNGFVERAPSQKACPDGFGLKHFEANAFESGLLAVTYCEHLATGAPSSSLIVLDSNAVKRVTPPEDLFPLGQPRTVPVVAVSRAWPIYFRGLLDGYGFTWREDYIFAGPTQLSGVPVNVAGGGTAALYAEQLSPAVFGPRAYVLHPKDGLSQLPIFNTLSQPWTYAVCGSLQFADGLALATPIDGYDPDTETFFYPSPGRVVLQSLEGIYRETNTPIAEVSSVDLPSGLCDPYRGSKQVRGSTFRLATGQTRALLAASDTLWTAPVTPQADGGVASFTARHVPAGRVILDELALTAPHLDAGEVASGYVMGQQRLFSIGAYNEIRWRSSELELPPGEPKKLWASGDYARVGYSDGLVYSLPSRVLLSNRLPTAVTDYAAVCGTGYALAGGKLYRLERAADGGTASDWAEVKLNWDVATNAPPALVNGKLHAASNALYVFSEQGVTAEVRGDCP